MAKTKAKPLSQMKHHWYFPEWAKLYGKRQVDAIEDLGWSKGKANAHFNASQPYLQEHLDEVSIWLNVKPYELLMHPDDAMRLRRLEQVIAEVPRPVAVETALVKVKKTGTEG